MFDHSRSWYHWRDGLYFQRQADGTVTLAQFEVAHDNSLLVWSRDIPASEWASIMASMCAAGENAESYVVASKFHEVGLRQTVFTVQ